MSSIARYAARVVVFLDRPIRAIESIARTLQRLEDIERAGKLVSCTSGCRSTVPGDDGPRDCGPIWFNIAAGCPKCGKGVHQ